MQFGQIPIPSHMNESYQTFLFQANSQGLT